MLFGMYAVTITANAEIQPGMIFYLRAQRPAATLQLEVDYPPVSHYLVHVNGDGAVLLPFNQAKEVLDQLIQLCLGHDMLAASTCATRFDKSTRREQGRHAAQRHLATAPPSVWRKVRRGRLPASFYKGNRYISERVYQHQQFRSDDLSCCAGSGGEMKPFDAF